MREKNVHSLADRGLVATCNVGGAGKWKPEYSNCLGGRSIAIIPDNDEPGHNHAQQVATRLYGQAARIKVVSVPVGKDATDYFDAGHSADDLLRQVDATPDWITSPKSEEPVIEAGESEPDTDPTQVIPLRFFRRTDIRTVPMPTSMEKAVDVFRKHGGILLTGQALKDGIHPRTLYEMRDEGLVERLCRGTYRLSELPPLSNPDLVTIAIKIPKGVICLLSALSYHGITTEIPHEVYVATHRDMTYPRLDYPPVSTVPQSDQQ